jgi:hypothetical protein
MRRDYDLHTRQEAPNGSEHHCVPLRIKMQFGLVDNEDALMELRAQECPEEREQLQLPRAQGIQRHSRTVGSDEKYVEPGVGIFAYGIDTEDLLATWVK